MLRQFTHPGVTDDTIKEGPFHGITSACTGLCRFFRQPFVVAVNAARYQPDSSVFRDPDSARDIAIKIIRRSVPDYMGD